MEEPRCTEINGKRVFVIRRVGKRQGVSKRSLSEQNQVNEKIKKLGDRYTEISTEIQRALGYHDQFKVMTDIAQKICNEMNLNLSRLIKRHKAAMICWYAENWDRVRPLFHAYAMQYTASLMENEGKKKMEDEETILIEDQNQDQGEQFSHFTPEQGNGSDEEASPEKETPIQRVTIPNILANPAKTQHIEMVALTQENMRQAPQKDPVKLPSIRKLTDSELHQ